MGDAEDRERVAAELRRIRDAVRERALLEVAKPASVNVTAPRPPEGVPAEPALEPSAPPPRPDGTVVNASWDVSKAPSGGFLGRVMRRALSPFVGAQVA